MFQFRMKNSNHSQILSIGLAALRTTKLSLVFVHIFDKNDAILLLLCTTHEHILWTRTEPKNSQKKTKNWTNEAAPSISCSMYVHDSGAHLNANTTNKFDRHETLHQRCNIDWLWAHNENGNENLNTFLRKVNIYLFFAYIFTNKWIGLGSFF